MQALEDGAIANPDENRMVGHYWLRNAALAPTPAISDSIEDCLQTILSLTERVHSGELAGADGRFEHLLVVGIGGSALGPQFVKDALGNPDGDTMHLHFLDNTDPDGIDRTLKALTNKLGQTLTVVISKSGGTPETRNGMLEAQAAYQAQQLDFGQHAIAITGEGVNSINTRSPTTGSHGSPCGIGWVVAPTSWPQSLSAAMQGIDIRGNAGRSCGDGSSDASHRTEQNPAALLALAWYRN